MRLFVLILTLLLTVAPAKAEDKATADPWSASVLHWVESGRPKFHIQFESLTIQNSSVRFQFDHFPAGTLRGFEQYWLNVKPGLLVDEDIKFEVQPGLIYTNRDQLLVGADFQVKIPAVRLAITQRSYLGGTDKHLTFVRWLPVKMGNLELGTIWHMNAKQSRSPDSYLGPSLTLASKLRLEGGISVTAKPGYFYGLTYTHQF